MNKTLRFIALVFLCAFLFGCGENSEGSGSFDPDNIAHVNNGDGVDFSEYDEVWEYQPDVSNTDYVISGIADSCWGKQGDGKDEHLYFVTEENPKNYRFVNNEFPSFCYYDMENQIIRLGTFSLYKEGSNFCVRIKINKTKDAEANFVDIEEKMAFIHKKDAVRFV